MKVAYLQKYQGEFPSPCTYSAWEGMRFLGYECRFFAEEELPYLSLAPGDVVVGWVRVVLAALDQMGVPRPPPLDYPEGLRRWWGRDIRQRTLGEVHDDFRTDKRSVFVKPVEHKLFTGHTIECNAHLLETADFPKTTPVWVSDIVHIVSEWRCFVMDRRLVGIKHYLGDPWVLPHKKSVIQMIFDYEGAPAAYALDVGVTPDGGVILVEVNDAFALGNYALSSLTYAEMIIARWDELVQR